MVNAVTSMTIFCCTLAFTFSIPSLGLSPSLAWWNLYKMSWDAKNTAKHTADVHAFSRVFRDEVLLYWSNVFLEMNEGLHVLNNVINRLLLPERLPWLSWIVSTKVTKTDHETIMQWLECEHVTNCISWTCWWVHEEDQANSLSLHTCKDRSSKHNLNMPWDTVYKKINRNDAQRSCMYVY